MKLAHRILVHQYKILDWEEPLTGLKISENKEWCLIQDIPYDYSIDGYKLLRKSFIEYKNRGKKERAIEKVLALKKTKIILPKNFLFMHLIDTLKWSEKQFGFFEFQDDAEDETFFGTLKLLSDKSLTINSVTAEGKVDQNFNYVFDHEKIRVVTFLTDYFQCIQLLMQSYR